MVDRLKQSLDQLETPICPNCHVEMRWSRSTLVADAPVTNAHLFQCPNCNRVAETKSQMTITPTRPDKLSAPRGEDRAA